MKVIDLIIKMLSLQQKCEVVNKISKKMIIISFKPIFYLQTALIHTYTMHFVCSKMKGVFHLALILQTLNNLVMN